MSYYFNTETHETSWTHPGIDHENEREIAEAPITIEVINEKMGKDTEGPAKKRKKEKDGVCLAKEALIVEFEAAVEAAENSKMSMKMNTKEKTKSKRKKKKKRKSGMDPGVDVVVLDFNDSKEVHRSHSSSDDEDIMDMLKKVESDLEKESRSKEESKVVHKPVDLNVSDRKPISFSVSAKTKTKFLHDLKSTSVKPADSAKSKHTVHPSILAFQRLSNSVKWSKPRTVDLKKEPPDSPKVMKKESQGIVTEEPKKRKTLDTVPKVKNRINSQSLNESLNLPLGFKIPKKKAANAKASESLLKGLVPDDYGSSDEEDNEELNKIKERDAARLSSLKRLIQDSKLPDSTHSDDGWKKRTPNQKQKKPMFEKVQENDCEYGGGEIVRDKAKRKEISQICDDEIEIVGDKAKRKEILQIHEEVIHITSPREKPDIEEVVVVKCIEEVEDMEVEDQEIMREIASLRGNVALSAQVSKKQECADFDRDTNSTYYVIDTNILLRDLSFLEDMKRREIDGRPVVIVIPYVVLEELDGLKKSSSVGKASQDAICWCNRHFENKDSRVVGQNYNDYLSILKENPQSVSMMYSFTLNFLFIYLFFFLNTSMYFVKMSHFYFTFGIRVNNGR